MKHKFNFISRVFNGGSTVVDTPVSKRSQVSNKCRLTLGRLSTLILLFFTFGVGNMWAWTVAGEGLPGLNNSGDSWNIHLEMSDRGNNLYSRTFYSVPVSSGTKYRFKIFSGSDWGNEKNTENMDNDQSDVTLSSTGNKNVSFDLSSAKNVTIWYNSSTQKIYVKLSDPTPECPQDMYIVGGAVDGGWGNFKKFEFISPGVYRWQGTLTANGGDNSCFKFAPQSSYSNEYRAEVNQTQVVLGTPYKLVQGGDDRKFMITTTGTYVITIDLTNSSDYKMTVTRPPYKIKHPWGGGDWTWQECTDNGDGTYSYVGLYGNNGCNIDPKVLNTDYIEPNNITKVGNPETGDECTFTVNPNATQQNQVITITKNGSPAPTPTNDYFWSDMWMNKSGWYDCGLRFMQIGDKEQLKVVMPNMKIRFEFYVNGTRKAVQDYWSSAGSNMTNTKSGSETKSVFNALGGTKLVTYEYKDSKLTANYSDYPKVYEGWKLFIDGNEQSGTTDANGAITVNVTDGTHKFYFTDGTTPTYQGVNWFGGLYINTSESSGVTFNNLQYYKTDAVGTFTAPISDVKGEGGNANYYMFGDGRFTLNETSNLTFTFDGGKITINKAAAKKTVTFETFCAQTVPSQSVAVGEKATNPGNLNAIKTQENNHEVATFGGWYADAACTESFDFNTTINEDKTIYAKWQMRSEDFYEVGDVWMADDNSNWRNGRNPKFTKSTDNRSMSVTYIAPKGTNRFEVIRGNNWGYKVPMVVDPNSPIEINIADSTMNFELTKVQEVTITYNGRFSVSARDYTPHFVSGKYISGNAWGKINGEAMINWNGNVSNQELKQEGDKAVIIVTEVPTGQHQFKIFDSKADEGVIGIDRFNAIYVDMTNTPNGLSWSPMNGTPFGYQLPITDQKQRDITFSLSRQMDLKITFDGGKITISEQVTVTFNTGGGSPTPDPQTIDKGGKATKPATDPKKDGYYFMGWSETEGGSVVDVTNITINADKTFYALWHQFTMQVVVDGSSATVTPTLPAHHGALTFCYTLLDNSDQPLAEQPEIMVNTTTGAATFTFTSDAKKVQCKVHDGADCNAELIATMTQSVGRNTPTNIAIHIDTDKWGRTTGQGFTLTVTGNNIDDDATYQWYRDNNAVSGATASTYTVASCTKDHAGEYKCVVSNGNKSAENADKHTLKVYSLLITVNNENTFYDFVHTNGDEGQATVFLNGSWTYEMKIYDNSGEQGYYGNDGTMTGQYCTDFAFDKTKRNCKINTSMGGDYIFTVKYGNDNYPSLSATYPLANQPGGKTIYFVNSQNWNNLHYRIGHNTNSAAQALTKVSGTDNLYKVVTNEYNSVDAWSIANNAGWTGNERTIYQPYDDNGTIKPNDGYAITRQTTFQKYIVSNPITLKPSSYSNTDNNCDYWHVDKTEGMLSHKVTISNYAHGTVTVAYTDVDDHAQNMTSGNADLAHTCILTISCASAQGYQVTSFKVNGENFTSGSQLILTEDITITATIDPNTTTPYTVNHNRQNANDDGYTLAETENKTGTTDTQVTPDRKSYEGFDAPAGQQVTINGDGTTVVNYNYTRKVYDVTYTDQGEGWTYGAKPESAKYDATVNFVVTPETGYEVTVSSPDVTIIQSGTDYSFTMPNKAVSVTVSATFTAELTLEATPAIAAPNAQVTATPDLTNFPTDIMICYTLYKGSVDDANKVDVEFSINKTDHKGQATFTAPAENGNYIVTADVHRGNDCSAKTILASAQATVTVKPLTNTFTNGAGDNKWSTVGNWSENMLPDAEMDVTIRAKAIVDINTAAAQSVVIDDNGHESEIEILSTGGLQVEGTITRTTDGENYGPTTVNDLYIHSDDTGTGALVFNNSNNCQAYVEMYSLGRKQDGKKLYQYVGTPFNDVKDVQHNYYGAWMYQWSVSDNGWTKMKNGNPAYPFLGYCISQPETEAYTYGMEGTLSATNKYECPLYYYSENAKENLLANSWTAPIDITQMTEDDFVNAEATIYIFNAGTRAQYDASASEQSPTATGAGQYIALPINTIKTIEATLKVIPAMQGFSVLAKSGGESKMILDYNRMVRKTGNSIGTNPMRAPQRYMANNEINPDVMHLQLVGSRFSDEVYLLEREDFSNGFDNGWDGRKMIGDENAPQMSVASETGSMAISATNQIDGTFVNISAGEDVEYTFYFDYDGDKLFFLNDMELQLSTPIQNGGTYKFNVNSDLNGRFMISTTPFESYIGTGSDNIGNGVQKAVKFIENDKLFILRNGRLYDGTGKALKPGK